MRNYLFYLIAFILLSGPITYSAEIVEVDIPPHMLDASGNFTEKGLEDFLQLQYQKNILNRDFESVTCLDIKNVYPTLHGITTVQLFSIKSTCVDPNETKSFFLKGEKNEVDMYKLLNLAQDSSLRPFRQSNRKGYPLVILPFAFFEYKYNPIFSNYITLSDQAPGRRLYEIYSDYFPKSDHESKIKLPKIFFDIGVALANFHQAFMDQSPQGKMIDKTRTHGDFYQLNIFYDEQSRQVTFLDNATIVGFSEGKKTPMEDIDKFVFNILSTGLDLREEQKRIAEVFVPFLQGYIQTYDISLQKKVYNLIENMIKKNMQDSLLWASKKDILESLLKQVKDSLEMNLQPLKHALFNLENAFKNLLQSMTF